MEQSPHSGEGGKGKMNKYHNIKTTVDGITFDSKAEARYYGIYKRFQEWGKISNLQRQIPYIFKIDGKKIFTYKADFQYTDKEGKEHVIDVKGVETPVFRLKKKLIEAQYGIEIEVVK